jgi:hypothetical protein
MLRTLALFGLATGFLSISPDLRNGVMGALGSAVQSIEHYSPYSYVTLGIVALGSFMVSLKRGSQPR